MKSREALMILGFLALTGCAYRLEPLMVYHPANPETVQSPPRSISKTLAYTKADMPATQPVLASAQEGKQEGQQPGPGERQTVVGEGRVIATVPNSSQIVVEHGEIKGFMDAMTMGYRVDPLSLLEGLKFGDKVRFTIDVPKKAIVKIEKLQ